MTINNKTYDHLKWVAMIFIPAASTLYFSLANVLGLPYAEQVVGTLAAIDTFIGALLGITTAQYNKRLDGVLNVTSTPEKDIYRIELENDLESLKHDQTLRIKINRNEVPNENEA